MPRGRPRKPRLSRMHAAVDAMVPYGFSEERVIKTAKALLKEYGGEDGWPFVEEYSYKELIEALLRDAEGDDHEKVAEDENQPQDKPYENETTTRDSDTQQDERPESNAPADVAMPTDEPTTCLKVVSSSSGINKGWKDIVLDGTDDTPNPVPCDNSGSKRWLPCYGWIESDEEDPPDTIICLTPNIGTKTERKRKSRWDIGPYDDA